MLGVPVLVGSCAYAVAEAAAWPGSVADKPNQARKFYSVMAAAMALGLALNFFGLNAVKMLFWSAVINGLLAPPLILLVILLTSSQKVMGARTNPSASEILGLDDASRDDGSSRRNARYVVAKRRRSRYSSRRATIGSSRAARRAGM